jgi:muramoyltetrapeptide carboxypeptidase LdcA involved in peptidoglycan recycling
MNNIYPDKLNVGDEIRVIAPAKSFKPEFTEEMKKIAIERLESLGLKVSFGKYVNEINEFESTTIEHRLEDLHNAFRDESIKGILTILGGTTSNQLLKYLDYDLIKSNPKILCGLSDITSLANAIHTKTGLVTYSGPHFTLFGAEKQTDYTIDYFKKCLFTEDTIEVKPSEMFCNNRWDSEEIKNYGFWIINNGEAEGTIIGGNLITLNLLQGSEYMPDLTDSILFLEDNDKESIRAVENHLQSLIHQPTFNKVKGILFGRFQIGTKMTKDILTQIVKTKKELDDIPVLANLDFGHTTPMITFPIGGECKVNTENKLVEITRH